MKYIIRRTSLVFDDDVRPCQQAIYDKELKEWIIEIQDIHKFVMYCDQMNKKWHNLKRPDWYWGSINLSFNEGFGLFEIEIVDSYQG